GRRVAIGAVAKGARKERSWGDHKTRCVESTRDVPYIGWQTACGPIHCAGREIQREDRVEMVVRSHASGGCPAGSHAAQYLTRYRVVVARSHVDLIALQIHSARAAPHRSAVIVFWHGVGLPFDLTGVHVQGNHAAAELPGPELWRNESSNQFFVGRNAHDRN